MRTWFSTGTRHDRYTPSASCNVLLCWCHFGSSDQRWPWPSAETTSVSRHFGLVTENLVLWFHQPTKKTTLRLSPYVLSRAPRGPPAAHSPQRTWLCPNTAWPTCCFSSKTCTFYTDDVNWLWIKIFFYIPIQSIDPADLSLLLF